MIVILSRSVPSQREYIRNEAYLGRYVQANLFALCWVERMLQIEGDKENRIMDWILRKFFTDTLYHSTSKRPDLYT